MQIPYKLAEVLFNHYNSYFDEIRYTCHCRPSRCGPRHAQVRARAAQRKESQLFRPAGTRGAVFRGRSLLWLYLLFAVIVLLVTANYVGGYLGREQAAERTVYFVAGPVVAERTVVVLFMRQDTLLVADVTRSSAEASWQMKSGFRFLPVDEAENVKRVRLGTIAQAPLIVAPSP